MRQKGSTLSRSFVILLLVVATALAQDYQIRTRVDLVVVPVTVTSSGNRLVTDLTEKDFKLLENGQPQTIAAFSIDQSNGMLNPIGWTSTQGAIPRGFNIDPSGRIRTAAPIAGRGSLQAEASALAKYVSDIERQTA